MAYFRGIIAPRPSLRSPKPDALTQNHSARPRRNAYVFGGEGEIRTHEPRKEPPVFKTGAFNRSATSPF
jgi:hypothetical protein